MDITALGKRARNFNRNIKLFQAIAVKNSEEELVNLNRDQMLKSKTSKGALIKPKYSEKYSRFKGFPNPNLKLSGDFQGEMFLETNENKGEFFISSFDPKITFLTDMYKNIFGIAPNNIVKASKKATSEFIKLYMDTVWII